MNTPTKKTTENIFKAPLTDNNKHSQVQHSEPKDRVILHSDCNCFYASVECLYNPEIRQKPVAVSGNPENRHGIILTKNEIAKKF